MNRTGGTHRGRTFGRLFESSAAPSGAMPDSPSDAVPEPVVCLDAFAAPGGAAGSGGLTGALEMMGIDALDAGEAAAVLEQLAALTAWAQAQQVRVVHRVEELIGAEVEEALTQPDPAMTMSLTAAEVGAVLRLPHMSAMRLVNESGLLCIRYPETLAHLSHGKISYRHAQAVLDQICDVPVLEQQSFQAELLDLAQHRTCAQFMRVARRLRERRWPETILERHRAALEERRVSFDPLPDGMCELSARIAAEKGQAIFTALTAAAQSQQRLGDPRTRDQLRADIFTSLVLTPGMAVGVREGVGPGAGSWPGGSTEPADGRAGNSRPGEGTGPERFSGPAGSSDPERGSDPERISDSADDHGSADLDGTTGIQTEIMVLIHADTLFGVDDQPAELNGYGPISSEAARRLAQQALHWTGLVQDRATGEILAVGRRRKVPAGLKRWLQARDGTCRFPGCSVSPPRTEIDHTIPWAQGGSTEHGNLANLCPKHHRYKTLGFWSARQPEPGVMEWKSSLGRKYRVNPELVYTGADTKPAASPGAD